MTSIEVKVAHLNAGPVKEPISQENIQAVVDLVRQWHGVGTYNEIETKADHEYIRNQPDIGSFLYGANGIIWDATRFEAVKTFHYKIMTGGYVGADGVATPQKGDDDRRVGPNRYLLIAVLKEIATGIEFIVACTHLVAKADTTAKWRQYLRAASIKVAGERLGALTNEYPNGLLNGDLNYRPAVLDFPGLNEVQLYTPITYGRTGRLDRGYTWGEVIIKGSVQTFDAKSDHRGIYYMVEIFDAESSTPTPIPPVVRPPNPRPVTKPRPKPGQRGVNWKAWGSPVPHPWLSRSARWRRRHPVQWARISRWRKKYIKNR